MCVCGGGGEGGLAMRLIESTKLKRSKEEKRRE